jgi:hypothetical protein
VPIVVPRNWQISVGTLSDTSYQGEQPGSPITQVKPNASRYQIGFVIPAPRVAHSVHAGGGYISGSIGPGSGPATCAGYRTPGARCPAFHARGTAIIYSLGSGGNFYSWSECGAYYTLNDNGIPADSDATVIATINGLKPLPGSPSCQSVLASQSVVIPTSPQGQPAVAPSAFIAGDGHVLFRDVRWSGWGNATATGHGEVGYRNCGSPCAGGVQWMATTVWLSGITACHARKYYGNLQYGTDGQMLLSKNDCLFQ